MNNHSDRDHACAWRPCRLVAKLAPVRSSARPTAPDSTVSTMVGGRTTIREPSAIYARFPMANVMSSFAAKRSSQMSFPWNSANSTGQPKATGRKLRFHGSRN